MSIDIEERFTVQAPPAAVWAFLVDPRRVVTCLPGAELAEVVDERTFLGNVRVKVGSLSLTYRGRVHLDEVDATAHRVRMTGEGRETAGTGQARLTMSSEVLARGERAAEVVVHAQVDVVGRIVQLGRGMIVEVAHQLFRELAACVAATLEAEAAAPAGAPGGAAAAGEAAAPPAPTAPTGGAAPRRQEAVRALPLLLAALVAWLRSLFGRPRRPRRA
jgi:carbon monoxide dehydrogenase subunit G